MKSLHRSHFGAIGASMAIALAALSMPGIAHAAGTQDVSGETPQDATITMTGTVNKAPAGMISVRMPTTLAFTIDLDPDGKFKALNGSNPVPSLINLSADAGLDAFITSVAETHPVGARALWDDVRISLGGAADITPTSGMRVSVGSLGKAGSANESTALSVGGSSLPSGAAIAPGAYTITPTITLIRKPIL